MDGQVTTSFIPKKPMMVSTRERPMGIYTFVSIVLFVISLVAAGGVYIYREGVKNDKETYSASLKKAQGAFEPNLLTDLNRFDTKLNTADVLLGRHKSLLSIFDFLEQSTLKNIRYRSFGFSFEPKTGAATLHMGGEALNYEAVALQSDVYGQSKQLKTFLVSDLSPDLLGKVTFNVSATFDPAFLTFSPGEPQQ